MQFDLIPPQRAFQAKSRELARGRIADRAAEIDRTERPICEFQGGALDAGRHGDADRGGANAALQGGGGSRGGFPDPTEATQVKIF